MVRESTRGSKILDLLFVDKQGLVGDVNVRSCLGHSDHEMLDFLILVEPRWGVSRTATLDFWRADFHLCRTMVERVPWEVVLESVGAQEGWEYFKAAFKGARPDHPHVTDELVGKEAGLAEQRHLAGSQEQKESLWSLEEWASYL